jgi:Icc-related predicted phosphoesterase
MKCVAISDAHSNLDFSIPECDLLLMAGDMLPAYCDCGLSIDMQINWLEDIFIPWTDKQPVKEIISVAGNHDWVFDMLKNEIPKMNDNFHYIEEEIIEIFGLKIYGSPYQPEFCSWAFNKTEDDLRDYHWSKIPEGLDILLLHGPPYGILDVNCGGTHIGSPSLLNRIISVKPRYAIFGHNHKDGGKTEILNGTTYINASLLNEPYKMDHKPVVFEI